MELPAAVVRFVSAAGELGLEVEPVVYPDGTKTAADAAAAIGCAVGAIVKSLVFMADDRPLLVLMAGDHRVDTTRLAEAASAATVRRATLEEARQHTGFAAGGTPPVGHPEPLAVLADRTLLRSHPVWAAAGTPTSVFPVDPERLVAVADARWVDVAEDGR
ncbi:MAG: YbaK/EbsC family protein [Actinomycetota bacterium]|nr:YbaK/EbsC family protein [Actinomycetota bacterium]